MGDEIENSILIAVGDREAHKLVAGERREQLAALTRETQLQGRATNRLHADLTAAMERLAQSVTPADAVARRLAEARREARLEVIGELLEVRDRLTRGLDEAP